ncbi:MAG: 30S ribosomal protein S6 [Syntrophobacter sp.]
MRKYETFFIVDPDLPDETNSVVDTKVQAIVTSNGGEVLAYTPWGKRKLAYPIRKHTRGLYVLIEYSGGADMVAELERNLRIDERVLKFITVKLEDRFDPEKERERRAAAAAAAAAPAPAFDEEEEGKASESGVEDDEAMPEDFEEEGFEGSKEEEEE